MSSQLNRTIRRSGPLAIVFTLLAFTVALAASGGLDTTFSGDGRQTTNFTLGSADEVHGLALQSDGKIVAVGDRYEPSNKNTTKHDFALARYKTGGALDTNFSTDGKVLTDFGGVDTAWSVAIQPLDGKIVVSGEKCTTGYTCDVAVARYKKDGTLDTTFSSDGKQVIPFGSGDNGSYGGLAIQSDGRIVIGGYMENAAGNYDFAVYRLNTNGTLDSSFSGDGRVNFAFGTNRQDFGENLRLQGNKIVIVGETCDENYAHCNFGVARLTSTGALDTTFSLDGKQTTDFGAEDYPYAVAIQGDGKIVVAGEKYGSASDVFAIARYNTAGNLDTTFSTDGKQTVIFGTWSWAQAVLTQSNGKIVVAGVADMGSSLDFGLVRLNPGGALDLTFGPDADGKTTVNFGTNNEDEAYAVLRQPDGKYVLGGYTLGGSARDFALARILP